MKFKYFILCGIVILLIFIVFNNKRKLQFVQDKDYAIAIQLGLEKEDLTEEQILIVESLKDNEKLIFFVNYNALGFSCLSKIKDEWVWKRTEALYSFQSSNTSSYMSSVIEIKTIKNHKYYLCLGEIFDSEINRIILYNDSINAKIIKTDNNIFWFAVIDTKLVNNSLNINTKAYDKIGNIIE
ncbi:hypothetical protein HZF24_15355 [Sedimentibacter hydroxybenzoicus DSM 7310]|uniref:Uncharacterized protein n=1 Tax=Sedimentibacter hydroxybenzoicus DSM 7310 TaxID=1123245 RepID=A0A974BLF5_SEDHY|nr:hypothetical protein [Sedimentibacter hydroxybenzoicus]NYB75524.1 hypothetical protein [Sedimentibacter hydroxybenzoicus DSM 7310]